MKSFAQLDNKLKLFLCDMKNACKLLNLSALAVVALLVIILCGCHKRPYLIGISQCADDVWHRKLTSEFLMMGYANDSVRVALKSSREDASLQAAQIDSLVAQNIDLLVVSPNNLDALTPAIERAYAKGIPVVLYDRRINSDKFTAFIGSDNYSIGYQLGDFIARKLNGTGKVVEVLGQRNSSSSFDRHKGFLASLRKYADVEVADTAFAYNWERDGGEAAMERLLGRTENFDYVFAHNDRMAYGVYQVLKQHDLVGKVKIVGVDGLPGKDGGLECVDKGMFEASYLNPTSGEDIMRLAMSILKGQKFERINKIPATIITKDNAHLTIMAMKSTNNQRSVMEKLNAKVDKYQRDETFHETLVWILIALLLLIGVIYKSYKIYSAKFRSFEAPVENKRKLTSEQIAQRSEDAAAENSNNKVNPLDENNDDLTAADKEFVSRLRDIVKENMGNSEFGVEAMGREMGFSRVQLYRKVKAVTGLSVVDMLRKSRLQRGMTLLRQTDKSIAEIAYEVGFSSPSYFTKCFKDEYGMLPCDIRQTISQENP